MNPIKTKIIEVANAILAKQIDTIKGCRKICSLRHEFDEDYSKLFKVFRGVDSETEEFLLDDARDRCDKDYLSKLDAEKEAYLKVVSPVIIAACRDLIHCFEHDDE